MTSTRTFVIRIAILGICSVGFTSCGSSPSSPSDSGTPTISLTPTGPQPTEVRISSGGRVMFVNNDVRPHEMTSDPPTGDPTRAPHTDCPPINDVGTLAPGQSRTTGALTVARTCGFHDHFNEFDDAWKGRIIIQ